MRPSSAALLPFLLPNVLESGGSEEKEEMSYMQEEVLVVHVQRGFRRFHFQI